MTDSRKLHAKDISIGALAQMTGIHIETIRYYERIGVLPKIPRNASGHRIYEPYQVKQLKFVKRSRELGFSLDDIRALIGLVNGGDYTCDQVKDLTTAHRDDVRAKIADLTKMERVLSDMVAQCSGKNVPDCPIIEVLQR